MEEEARAQRALERKKRKQLEQQRDNDELVDDGVAAVDGGEGSRQGSSADIDADTSASNTVDAKKDRNKKAAKSTAEPAKRAGTAQAAQAAKEVPSADSNKRKGNDKQGRDVAPPHIIIPDADDEDDDFDGLIDHDEF
jgi:hypothetical protein